MPHHFLFSVQFSYKYYRREIKKKFCGYGYTGYIVFLKRYLYIIGLIQMRIY